MTLTIDLPPKAEEQLRNIASERGESEKEVAAKMLVDALNWEEHDRLEMIEGIKRGLEASAAGRLRPASEVIADLRARAESMHK